VIKITCDQLGTTADKISDTTSFVNDLGADSLDTVELVMSFEDEFEISIPDEDAEKIQSVGDAIRYVEEKVKA
jgi:acyl carrier protein